MVQSLQKSEKVTITIPCELKEKLKALKREFKTTTSSIYKEALENYIEQKEMEKWQKGAKLASADKEYLSFINEINNDQCEIWEVESFPQIGSEIGKKDLQ